MSLTHGLYYMWIRLAGKNNIRDLYGYILVDNLQPEIALDSITLPATAEVQIGETLTLKPKFSPNNTTNKIVTWTSSDESVATVDNAGKVTPKKIGATIITVTAEDGGKKASCTVTVTEAKVTDPDKPSNTGDEKGNPDKKPRHDVEKKDNTEAKENLPKTGVSLIMLSLCIIACTLIGIYTYKKHKNLKEI